VLFELCRALDLQLLIAAPEVARAEGNTTYRLIRRVSESGAEEVLVTGRRAIKDGEAEPAADEPLDAPDATELSPELSS
jgi:chromosome partition protein MukB